MQFFILLILRLPLWFIYELGEPFRYDPTKRHYVEGRGYENVSYGSQLAYDYAGRFFFTLLFVVVMTLIGFIIFAFPKIFAVLFFVILLIDGIHAFARFLWFKRNVVKSDVANLPALYGQGGWKDDPAP